jgi:hypothetical protein
VRGRVAAVLAACAVLAGTATSTAAPSPPVLSRAGQTVTWEGTTPRPDPAGCGELASTGCDLTTLTVVARQGAWITVSAEGSGSGYLRVTQGGRHVASNGFHAGTRSFDNNTKTSTTFQQVRSGRVDYEVGVSGVGGGFAYTGRAQLAGSAFDREGECFVGDSGVGALLAPDDGRLLRLSVRLVSAPADAPEVRRVVGPAVVEAFRRIGIEVRVSYDAMALDGYASYPFEVVQRRYGGVRPRGVDAVHVLSDDFTGGYAQCIGGVAYPEKAFSTGSLRYAPAGGVTSPLGSGATIAVHEIGHTLGGQHQMASCVEAAPQLVAQPPSDGSTGPCTVMSPTGFQQSQAFSLQERAAIRDAVRRYAGR